MPPAAQLGEVDDERVYTSSDGKPGGGDGVVTEHDPLFFIATDVRSRLPQPLDASRVPAE